MRNVAQELLSPDRAQEALALELLDLPAVVVAASDAATGSDIPEPAVVEQAVVEQAVVEQTLVEQAVADPEMRVSPVSVRLREQVEKVTALGNTSADIDRLTDAELVQGQKWFADARRSLDSYGAWLAASTARRSRRELGSAGLASQHGFVSAEAMIQGLTGSTRGDASKLVAVGAMMAEAEAVDLFNTAAMAEAEAVASGTDPDAAAPHLLAVPWQAPIVRAVTAGSLSVDKAEAIRNGLGGVDAAVTVRKA